MNHNFANWELTQMLPDRNKFSEWYIDSQNNLINNSCINTFKDVVFTLPVWDWEDIRLYLKSQGFVICYTPDTKDCNAFIYRYNFDGDMFINDKKEIRGTYEEIRIESIKYCLNLINATND